MSAKAKRFIVDQSNEILVSAASAWEISTKVRLGKLTLSIDLIRDFDNFLSRDVFFFLSITGEHGIRAGLLPGAHKDRFDRMLIAQAEAITIISNEEAFDEYGVRRLW